MPHFDRGVYEPGEDARVFDGSEDEEDVEGSRLPLLIVLALLVLIMFAGVVWLAYTQGVARGRTETPVITAEAGPARVAPQNPGGAQQPYQGFKIYEQPAPPDDQTGDSQPQIPVNGPVPKAAVAGPVPDAAPKIALNQPEPKPAATDSAPPPDAAPAPAKPAPVVKSPAPAAKPAPAKVAPVKAASVAKPAPAPLQIGPATAPPRALNNAAPKPAPAEASASGSYVLQIGAYKSQADAEAAWKTYKAKHAALLADSNSNVQQADLGDKGTWYRLRITGFASKDVASALCDRLKTDGGSCFLGK